MKIKEFKKSICIKIDKETEIYHAYLKTRINISELVRDALKKEYEKIKPIVDK